MPSLKNSNWFLLFSCHWKTGVYKQVKKGTKIYKNKKGHYLNINRKRYYINLN